MSEVDGFVLRIAVLEKRVDELEAAIRYGIDLLRGDLVEEAIFEMERRLTGADK